MSSLYKWDGTTLRGPLKPATEEGGVKLPQGPPESTPFDTDGWHFEIKSTNGITSLKLMWTTLIAHPDDLSVQYFSTPSGSPSSRSLVIHGAFMSSNVW